MRQIARPPKSWNDPNKHYQVVLESPWYKSISRLQAEFIKATVDFYKKENMDFILLPVTTGSISSPMGLGSDSIPVKVTISGVDTYLADSMQFFLEYACRINRNNTYYIAPSFRGEKADARHLSQFYHSEAEIIGELDDVILLVEKYLFSLISHYLESCSDLLLSVTEDLEHLKNALKVSKFPKCTFDEAVKILKDNPEFIKNWDNKYRTITSRGEAQLIQHFEGFVWLTHFDSLSVPFYQKSNPANPKQSLTADLLMGIGETVGSGERHSTGDDVVEALNQHQVSSEDYRWYIDMKSISPLQTSGFGMGVERFLLWLIKHDDIRDVQILPRFNGERSIV